MSPAAVALIIIAIPPVVGIIWHGVVSDKSRDKVRRAVCSTESFIESMGERSERFKDRFTRPTL